MVLGCSVSIYWCLAHFLFSNRQIITCLFCLSYNFQWSYLWSMEMREQREVNFNMACPIKHPLPTYLFLPFCCLKPVEQQNSFHLRLSVMIFNFLGLLSSTHLPCIRSSQQRLGLYYISLWILFDSTFKAILQILIRMWSQSLSLSPLANFIPFSELYLHLAEI